MNILLLLLPLFFSCCHGNDFFGYVEQERVGLVSEFGSSDYHSIDINKVLTSYILKLGHIKEGSQELWELQKKAFLMTDSEFRLLYRYYGIEVKDLIDVSRLEEDLKFFTSLASPLIIASFKSIEYIDTDSFQEEVIKHRRDWLIIFVKELQLDEIELKNQQTVALIGEDLSVYDVRIGLVQCESNPDFCHNLEHGITFRFYPDDVQYSGPLSHAHVVSFVLKHLTQSKFYRVKSKEELTSLSKSGPVIVATDDKMGKVNDLYLLDIMGYSQSRLNVARIDCSTTIDDDLCKVNNETRSSGVSVLHAAGSSQKEVFIANAHELPDSSGRSAAQFQLSKWISENVVPNNTLLPEDVTRLLAEGVNQTTVLWKSRSYEIWLHARLLDMLPQPAYLYLIPEIDSLVPPAFADITEVKVEEKKVEEKKEEENVPLSGESQLVVLNPNSKSPDSQTPEVLSPPTGSLDLSHPDTLIFISTVIRNSRIAHFVDRDHPARNDSFITVNLALCHNLVTQKDTLNQLGAALDDLALERDPCYHDDHRCTTHMNVYLERKDDRACMLEVVRSDFPEVSMPYYYGHLVAEEFRQFIVAVRNLKIVSTREECDDEKLGFVMGNKSADVDYLFFNQVIRFSSSHHEPVCFITNTTSTPLPAEVKQAVTGIVENDSENSVWYTEEEDTKYIAPNRTSYLFKMDTNQRFDNLIPTLTELTRWYVSKPLSNITETPPWAILEQSQSGKAIVLLYEKEAPELALRELGDLNSKMEFGSIEKLDCSQYQAFCRKLQEGSKLPLVAVLESSSTHLIPVTRKSGALTNALSEHVVLISAAVQQTSEEDWYNEDEDPALPLPQGGFHISTERDTNIWQDFRPKVPLSTMENEPYSSGLDDMGDEEIAFDSTYVVPPPPSVLKDEL